LVEDRLLWSHALKSKHEGTTDALKEAARFTNSGPIYQLDKNTFRRLLCF